MAGGENVGRIKKVFLECFKGFLTSDVIQLQTVKWKKGKEKITSSSELEEKKKQTKLALQHNWVFLCLAHSLLPT